jgi:hypothetical protein
VATAGQLSFLSRGPLFESQVLQQYLADHRTTRIPEEESRVQALSGWILSLRGAARKETALEQSFNSTVLGEVLGYTLFPSPSATAYPKAPSSVTGIVQEPDVLLGRFVPSEDDEPIAVLELKSPGTPFDSPQSRADRRSPVEQAFNYGQRILGVRWVLVSDMRVIRLYAVDSLTEFETFDLRECIEAGRPTAAFRRLYFLLHHDYLVGEERTAPVASLLAKSHTRQRRIKDSFYATYYEIRMDVLAAVEDATASLQPPPTRPELLEAVQRLLDRMVFLYYCEDTPDQLIPRDTVKSVTDAARRLPGPSQHKVYDALKALFREVDVGSPPANLVRLNGYNGELFKHHRLVDEIDLPDTLHDKRYIVEEPDGGRRGIQGVWGLHEFDFWRELNEHLLGHIFEESLSDLVAIEAGQAVSLAEKLTERKRHGIYYTTDLLSDFLSASALTAVLDESEFLTYARDEDDLDPVERRLDRLASLRIVDFACGSGAFLVSAYQALLREYWSLQDAVAHLRGDALDLLTQTALLSQASLLRDSLYGSDLLPQAVELAKLALWLRSARKGEKVADLGTNIVSANSLHVHETLSAMNTSLGEFDLVLGNPPWGGEVGPDELTASCEALNLDPTAGWDSYELFLVLAVQALGEGGRLALVLPDTFFRRDKSKSRRLLLDYTRIEKLHNLGPGWFPNVRMGTILLQARRGPKPLTSEFTSMVLTGTYRERAIEGSLPLTQIEAQLGREIPQERSDTSPELEIEIFRSATDDEVMGTLETSGVRLGDLCTRGRGVEMSKAGLVWRCPSCTALTVPGVKVKGGGFKPKRCPSCGLQLNAANVTTEFLVRNLDGTPPDEDERLFVDGDDISRRYVRLEPDKALRLGVESIKYKNPSDYSAPKVMIRKTGIGLVAALDHDGVYCPQTIFFYRLKPEAIAAGYTHEFLLAALLSRTLAYYMFKRYSELDPDRSHAHVTYNRLDELPIPRLNRSVARQDDLARKVDRHVTALLAGVAELGGQEDWAVELALRELWDLSPEQGAYINGEFAFLPTSQPLRDLFPDGVPRPARTIDVATA